MEGMRRRLFAGVAAAGWLLKGCGGSREGARAAGFVRVSRRAARYFELDDGSPFIPIGLNIAFPRFEVAEGPVLSHLAAQMKRLSENGGNFVRIWIGHPFYDVEHEFSGKYDSVKLRRVDRVIQAARQHNLRLKLTFEHFRTLEERPPRFPGSVSMGKPLHHVSHGGLARNMTEFFTLPRSRERFRRKIAWFAERYRDEPAVMAWELWNEIDAVEGERWMEWTGEMLDTVHREFPRHLAVQSVGSLDVFRKRYLHGAVWNMAGNDFAQVHRYLDAAADLDVCRGPVDVMAADAVRTARELSESKPVILAESGAVEAGHSGPSELYERDVEGSILHDVLFAPFFAGSAGGGQIWHWDYYVERNDLWRHFGRFAAVVKGLDPPAERFEPGEIAHQRLRIYTLRGRTTFLAWCRDKGSDWRTELEQGRPPELLEGMAVDLGRVPGGVPSGVFRLYDPWEDRWTDGAVERGRLALPAFRRSLVIRAGG